MREDQIYIKKQEKTEKMTQSGGGCRLSTRGVLNPPPPRGGGVQILHASMWNIGYRVRWLRDPALKKKESRLYMNIKHNVNDAFGSSNNLSYLQNNDYILQFFRNQY